MAKPAEIAIIDCSATPQLINCLGNFSENFEIAPTGDMSAAKTQILSFFNEASYMVSANLFLNFNPSQFLKLLN